MLLRVTGVRRSIVVSYAHRDTVLVERFLDLMRVRWSNLRGLELDSWWDEQICTGERWRERIHAAIDRSDFGLLCVTYGFLASTFVTESELPVLLAKGNIIAVALEPIDMVHTNLKGLEDHQLFFYRRPRSNARRAFSECGAPNTGRFCNALLADIADRIFPPEAT